MGKIRGTPCMGRHIVVHRATTKSSAKSFSFRSKIEKEGLPRDSTPDLETSAHRLVGKLHAYLASRGERLQLLDVVVRNDADLDGFGVDLLDWFIASDKAVTQPLKFSGGDTTIVVDALPICFYSFLDIESKRNSFRFGESKACRFA